MNRYLLPLAFFLLSSSTVTLAAGAAPPPGQAAPAFSLARLDDPQQRFSPAQLKGQVWVLNVWASWCTGCREEHPAWLTLAPRLGVPLVGLNYQDKREAGLRWLQQHGNPYRIAVSDPDGRAATDWGVESLPATFVLDRQGRIRWRHAGPVTQQQLQQTVLPLIRELQRG